MLRSIGKPSGESVEEEKEGYGGVDLQKRKVLKSLEVDGEKPGVDSRDGGTYWKERSVIRYYEWVLNKAGVKWELLDTVKARNLAYYGHTMRKRKLYIAWKKR